MPAVILKKAEDEISLSFPANPKEDLAIFEISYFRYAKHFRYVTHAGGHKRETLISPS